MDKGLREALEKLKDLRNEMQDGLQPRQARQAILSYADKVDDVIRILRVLAFPETNPAPAAANQPEGELLVQLEAAKDLFEMDEECQIVGTSAWHWLKRVEALLAATPATPLAEELEELVAIDIPADGCLLKSNKYVKLADVRELLARKGTTE